MKKFKYLLIALVAAVLCSCAMSVEDVAEEVRDDIKTKLEAQGNTNVQVGEVVLVHKGGNDYTSVVSVSANGYTQDCSLYVTFDGESYTWELFE